MISSLHLIKVTDKNHKLISNTALERKHNFRHIAFWLAIVGSIVGFIAFFIKIYSMCNADLQDPEKVSVYKNIIARLWFEVFQFFTEQNNMLIVICYILFLTCFKTKLFNRRNFITACAIYINLVMFGYWIVIIPSALSSGTFNKNPYELATTLCFHLFCPVIFDLFFLTSVNYPYLSRNPANRITNSSFWFYLAFYVCAFSLYSVSINFTELPASFYFDKSLPAEGHRYATVYGIITNFNSNCYNIIYDKNSTPYFDPNSKGNIFYLLVAFPVFFLFILLASVCVSTNNILCTPRSMTNMIYEANKHFEDEENEFFMMYNKVAKMLIKDEIKESKEKLKNKKAKREQYLKAKQKVIKDNKKVKVQKENKQVTTKVAKPTNSSISKKIKVKPNNVKK